MRALLTLLLTGLVSLSQADTWSIEHHRGLPSKQRGNLKVDLFGSRVFSHAFNTPPRSHFPRKIPAGSHVELVYTVEETAGAVWGGNPMRENVPEVEANIGILIQHDWNTGMGRWFSHARGPLTPGTHRLIVPIVPSAWVHVWGKLGDYSADHRRGWRDVWREPSRVGVCAGGFLRAHGVEVLSGSGTIRVLTLRVRS
jgi:hypothetical protein